MAMKYAVDLAGLSAFAEHAAVMMLLNPVIEARQVVQTDRDLIAGGMAVVLECDEERAKAIMHVIRQRIGKHEIPFWKSSTGNSWTRI